MRDFAEILLGLILGALIHREIVMAGFRLLIRHGDIVLRPRDAGEAE